jgi:hypothetical protein
VGESITAVRNSLGPFRTFRRTGEHRDTDQFYEAGALVTYDKHGSVEFVELVPPSDPTIHGVRLIQRGLEHVRDELSRKSVNVRTTVEGADLAEWDISIYAPEGVVEAVSYGLP